MTLTFALLLLAGGASPVLIEQVAPRSAVEGVARRQVETAVEVLPISPIGASATEPNNLSPQEAAAWALEQECHAAHLRGLALPEACEEALEQRQQVSAHNPEGNLLELLGQDATLAPPLQRQSHLQDADALVRNAGSAQGLRAEDAATIIAAQRGAVAPPGR